MFIISYLIQFNSSDSLPQTICPVCLLQSCKIYKFREMAFKSNVLLRQKVLKFHQSTKQSSPAKKQIHSINKLRNVLVEEAEVVAANDDDDTVELLEKCEVDEADNNIEYVTVIFENDESMEGSESKIEVLEDSSELEAIRENEYSVADESTLDTIPKISLKRTRRRRRSKSDGNHSLTCPECGKVLSNASSFKYHMQLHSDATPFLCSDCGEGFKTRNAYDGHLVTHLESNPNKCNVCGKSYRQAASLRSHMLIHTGEKVTITA